MKFGLFSGDRPKLSLADQTVAERAAQPVIDDGHQLVAGRSGPRSALNLRIAS